jgi:mannose-1-phosphate guanylyltransferase
VIEAVILAGGEGTRLRPLTNTTPKSLLPICNVPFLEHQLRLLAANGLRRVVLLTGYLPEAFAPFAERVGAQLGVRLEISREDHPLGTAGAVRSVLDRLDGPTFVFNGDVLTDLDLRGMRRIHAERDASVTIALTRVEDAGAYGLVPIDRDGRVREFVEKPAPEIARSGGLINAGTYVIDPRVLAAMPSGEMWSFERQVFPSLLAAGERLFAFPSEAYWIDIGTPARYLTAHADALDGRISIAMAGRRAQGGVLVGDGADVSPDARLGPHVVLGGSSVVESGANISGSVLLQSARVGAGATIRRSIVGEGGAIAPGAIIEDAVLAG